MLFYILLLSLPMATAFFTQNLKQSRTICIVLSTILGTIASFRGYVGTDTYSYHLQFESISKLILTDYNNFILIEPAFIFIATIVNFFNGNSFTYIIFIGILQTLLLIFILTKIKNPTLFIIFYIPSFYLNLHFNILREGTSLLLIITSLSFLKNNKVFYFILFIANLFHFSAIIFTIHLIFYKSIKINTSKIKILVFLLLIFITSNTLDFSTPYEEKFINYDYEFTYVNFGAGFFLQIILYFLLCIILYVQNKIEIIFFLLPIILFKILVLVFPLLDRIGIYFILTLLFLLTNKDIKLTYQRNRYASFILVTLSLLNSYGALINLNTENKLSLDEAHSTSPYIPYHTLFLDNL